MYGCYSYQGRKGMGLVIFVLQIYHISSKKLSHLSGDPTHACQKQQQQYMVRGLQISLVDLDIKGILAVHSSTSFEG